jgi:antitoxin ChpS
MKTTKLLKVDDSTMVEIPSEILEQLHLEAGSAVRLAIEEGWLIVDGRTKPRYTIEELLASSDYTVPQSAEDREWIDAPSVGRES